MSRESVAENGRRYLVEGRLTVTQLDALSIEASCRGGGAVYELGHNGADWWCSCLALGRCTHLVALQLVAVRDGRPHSLQTKSGVLNSQSRSSRAARSRAE